MSWLYTLDVLAQIDTIRFIYCFLWEGLAIGQFLRDLGPSLLHLALSVHFHEDASQKPLGTEPFSGEINLRYNYNLRSLHFDDVDLSQDFCKKTFLTWITTLVAQATSTACEEIEFDIGITNIDDVDLIDWSAIENLSTELAGLKRIRIVLGAYNGYSCHELQYWSGRDPLRDKFFLWDSIGVLHITRIP